MGAVAMTSVADPFDLDVEYPPRDRWIKRANGQTYLSPVDRLLDLCIEDDDCWLYQGKTDRKGYVRSRMQGRKTYGHRVIWEYFIAPWPTGLTYDHLCRRKNCLNPWHGDPVPSAVNSRRAPNNLGVLNAAKTHCPQGHPYDGDNLRFATRGEGRVCRICRAESSRAYRLRLKESK